MPLRRQNPANPVEPQTEESTAPMNEPERPRPPINRLATTSPDEGHDRPISPNRPANHWGVLTDDLHVEVADGRSSRVLIEGLSLDCPPGTMSAITGPSGCGKTTLLTCLAGVATFKGGRAWVAGQERHAGKLAQPAQLREIGVMFQDYRLIRSLNVQDNVAITLRLSGWTWGSARPAAADLLEQFGLETHLKKRPSSLSGGEQQRVALARAAIGRPKVLLADEPSAHLDREAAHLLASYLLGLAEWGACVVVSSHDPRLLRACQRVIDIG